MNTINFKVNRLIILMLIVFTSKNLLCQDFALPGKMHFIDLGKNQVKLKFKMVNNLIIIPLHVNNSDTLHFILDTGVKTTLITELDEYDSLLINFARKVKIHGIGSGDPLDAYQSYGNYFRIPGIEGHNMNINVLLSNIFHLTDKLGVEINGLIGYDVFSNFIVDINYQTKTITFYRPNEYRYRPGKYEIFPITINKNKPYMTTNVEIKQNESIKVHLLIDTGASDALWLFPKAHTQINIPATNIETYLGKGLNGDVHGVKARIASLNMGKFVLNEPIVSFPDSVSIKHVLAFDGRHGSLGAEILRRFRVIIDYTSKRIALKRTFLLNDPFRYNMSGLELDAPVPGVPVYMISNLFKDSPADKAGFMVGDQILEINNKKAFEYRLQEIYQIFQSKPGKEIYIKILRNGVEYEAHIELEKTL